MLKTVFKFHFVLLIVLLPLVSFAKDPKPLLLVYGSTIEAYVAALLAANSGVATVWVDENSSWTQDIDKDVFSVKSKMKLNGGVWQFLIESSSQGLDLVEQEAKRLDAILENKSSLLKIVNGSNILKVERTSKSWKVILSDQTKYDVKVLVDASEEQSMKKMAGIKSNNQIKTIGVKDVSLGSSRSIVHVGEYDGNIRIVRLNDIVSNDNNFFEINAPYDEFIPNRISYSQTIGAVSAYCAFFKTSIDKVDLRVLQQELLLWRSRMLPCVDISVDDKHFRSVERVFLSGILPLKWNENSDLIFDPKDSIKVADIKPILANMYSRTQLWFEDNRIEYLTLKDLLQLIKYAAFRGEELDGEVEKLWEKEFAFRDKFSLSRVVTRYEFAVLFDKYASPFVKKVSQNGEEVYR